MAGKQRARAADPGAAASGSFRDLAAEYSSHSAQIYDDLGRRLPGLATSTVWRWAEARS